MRDNDTPLDHAASPAVRLVKAGEDGKDCSQPSQANQNRPKLHLLSRNISIHGHRTSVRLEPEMWAAYAEICRREGLNIHQLASRIADRIAPKQSLTSAIRVFIMAYFRSSSTEEGHAKAGHPSHKVGYPTNFSAEKAPHRGR